MTTQQAELAVLYEDGKVPYSEEIERALLSLDAFEKFSEKLSEGDENENTKLLLSWWRA